MSEPETTEQIDIAQLQLEKDMLLHQVKNPSSEMGGLESELRGFERVIQRLTTNQVQATPEPPPGPFRIRGSSKPT